MATVASTESGTDNRSTEHIARYTKSPPSDSKSFNDIVNGGHKRGGMLPIMRDAGSGSRFQRGVGVAIRVDVIVTFMRDAGIITLQVACVLHPQSFYRFLFPRFSGRS